MTKCFWKAALGMASSSISLMLDEDVVNTSLNYLISRAINDDMTSVQSIYFDDRVETSNNENDIARIVASRSIVDDDDEEDGLESPESYNQYVKISVKSYQESLLMIQQLEEFSKKEECTARLQHLRMVKCEYENN